jgi:dinuclear metal center YbgI/SA1388 family protein
MTTVADLAAWLEGFAPRALAEPWDNVGLLWGDPAATVERVMTCLTVTPATADEAIVAGAGAIVSHHPVLFKPVKAIRADRPETGFLWRLARAGTAILSPHTSFDNTVGGINDGLAERLGLVEVRPLRDGLASKQFKVVVFVPPKDREPVLDSAFAAGAGRIGDYEQCSFTTAGRGTFFGMEGTTPTVGKSGRRETVREWKVEVVCPGGRLAAVLATIRSSHSYEEPAIDVFPLADGAPDSPGVGRIGRIATPEALGLLASRIGETLGARSVSFVGDPHRSVSTLAIACGAGDDFLGDAHAAGADALLTGEARFHRALEAEALGLGLIVAGHHATERPGVEDLARRIAGAFSELEVWASRREEDPLRPT